MNIEPVRREVEFVGVIIEQTVRFIILPTATAHLSLSHITFKVTYFYNTLRKMESLYLVILLYFTR